MLVSGPSWIRRLVLDDVVVYIWCERPRDIDDSMLEVDASVYDVQQLCTRPSATRWTPQSTLQSELHPGSQRVDLLCCVSSCDACQKAQAPIDGFVFGRSRMHWHNSNGATTAAATEFNTFMKEWTGSCIDVPLTDRCRKLAGEYAARLRSNGDGTTKTTVERLIEDVPPHAGMPVPATDSARRRYPPLNSKPALRIVPKKIWDSVSPILTKQSMARLPSESKTLKVVHATDALLVDVAMYSAVQVLACAGAALHILLEVENNSTRRFVIHADHDSADLIQQTLEHAGYRIKGQSRPSQPPSLRCTDTTDIKPPLFSP